MLLTGVTPGSANPRHAISLSKRLGQPWESRPRVLPTPPPPPAGSGLPRGEPGTRASPPEPQRGSLRVGLAYSGNLRAGDGKAWAGTTIHPPTAVGCGCLSLPPLLRGRFIREQGARRQSEEECLLPKGLPMVWAIAPGAAPLLLLPGYQSRTQHCSCPHMSTSWVTRPFRRSLGMQPSPSSHNSLAAAAAAAAVIPLVSWEK